MTEATVHIEHNESFDLALRFVTETAENVFLTGKAGTGKTTFLKFLRQGCIKNMLVAAPTGVAAINCGGVTLHSLFQLPLHCFLPTHSNKEELLKKLKFNKQRKELLCKMELLVIDEISMVRADTLDAIDTILRWVRRNPLEAFGGVQLLCIGDLFQLPPVVKNDEWLLMREHYNTPFFFDSRVIQEHRPILIELTKIYRQKEEAFVELLNKVRNNQMDETDYEKLHQRYLPSFVAAKEDKYITLTTHNAQADQINYREINKLMSPAYFYKATIVGDFPENMYPVEAALELKEGAQVMFLKNDVAGKRYFNGKIGVVSKLKEDIIEVESDGDLIEVNKDTWEHTRYQLNRQDGRLEQEVLGSFEQYPLRLAWAITVHKSQGLSFDKVMIDAGAAFSSGQVYVALSRCTSLQGIVLLSKIMATAIISNDNVAKGENNLRISGTLPERFEGARSAYVQQILAAIFLFDDIQKLFTVLLNQVQENYHRLNQAGVDELMLVYQQFLQTKQVGEKFMSHVNYHLKEEPVVEINAVLQKRISDAANHFEDRWNELIELFKNLLLSTEFKEASDAIDGPLNDLGYSFLSSLYSLQACKLPFELTSFLKHRLNYQISKLNWSIYAGNKTQQFFANDNTAHSTLYNLLLTWRNSVVTETGVPVYLVANAQSLKAICKYLPFTKSDLKKIAGFGEAKTAKFGDEILQMVTDYCNSNAIASNMSSLGIIAKETAPKKVKENSKFISLALFKSGKTIAEIAKERGFATATIEGHLAYYIESGELPIYKLVDKDRFNLFKQTVTNSSLTTLSEIKEKLPGFQFGELRMMMAAVRHMQGIAEIKTE